ncbi:MAG: hypothetical protein JO248_02755 [Acidimicrobiia bacterium]|nr:hypothetical protein [Acidimicrobiia bacterium]MBV8983347.1 hypothetical protein [Acidimicrobiia bacterium]
MPNSWGKKWGQKGHYTMPFAYVTDPQLAMDFWGIYAVEKNGQATTRSREATTKRAVTRQRG